MKNVGKYVNVNGLIINLNCMGTAKDEFKVQLVSVSISKQGEGRIVFACDKNAFLKLDELKSMECGLTLCLKEAPKEKMVGVILSISSTSAETNPRKFVFSVSESEKVKTAEFATLVGAELDIVIEPLETKLPLA